MEKTPLNDGENTQEAQPPQEHYPLLLKGLLAVASVGLRGNLSSLGLARPPEQDPWDELEDAYRRVEGIEQMVNDHNPEADDIDDLKDRVKKTLWSMAFGLDSKKKEK